MLELPLMPWSTDSPWGGLDIASYDTGSNCSGLFSLAAPAAAEGVHTVP
jgi:hypothetical protein